MTYQPSPVEQSVRRWAVSLASRTGIPAASILYGRQNAPRPASTFLLITPILQTTPYEGRPTKVLTDTPYLATADYTAQITERQRHIIQLDIFAPSGLDIAHIMAASLDDALTQELNFTAAAPYAPILIDDLSNIRDTADLEGGQYRDRWTCELVVYAGTRTDWQAQAVETASMTLNLEE
jgi:hypothetical protein